jgi:hypothetical protein
MWLMSPQKKSPHFRRGWDGARRPLFNHGMHALRSSIVQCLWKILFRDGDTSAARVEFCAVPPRSAVHQSTYLRIKLPSTVHGIRLTN